MVSYSEPTDGHPSDDPLHSPVLEQGRQSQAVKDATVARLIGLGLSSEEVETILKG